MRTNRCHDCGNLWKDPHQVWCVKYREPQEPREPRQPLIEFPRLHMQIEGGPMPVWASIDWVRAQVAKKTNHK